MLFESLHPGKKKEQSKNVKECMHSIPVAQMVLAMPRLWVRFPGNA